MESLASFVFKCNCMGGLIKLLLKVSFNKLSLN
jgi:hypothetical protein